MSVSVSASAIFGTRLVAPPQSHHTLPQTPSTLNLNFSYGSGLVIECSSRPQKKAMAHHKKTWPRKTQKWDIRRGPTVYAPLTPLPDKWILVSEFNADDAPVVEQGESEGMWVIPSILEKYVENYIVVLKE